MLLDVIEQVENLFKEEATEEKGERARMVSVILFVMCHPSHLNNQYVRFESCSSCTTLSEEGGSEYEFVGSMLIEYLTSKFCLL